MKLSLLISFLRKGNNWSMAVLTVEWLQEDCAQLLKSRKKYLILSNWVQEIYNRSVLQTRSSKSYAKWTFSIWHRRQIGRRYGSLWQKGNLKIIRNSQKFRAGGGMWLLSNSLDVTAWKIVSPLQNAPSSHPSWILLPQNRCSGPLLTD